MKEISAIEFKTLRESGKHFQLIDVREAFEAEVCTMGGDLIPMGEIIARRSEIRTDVPVIIHCKSGNRAAAVIQALEARYGFSDLTNLKGGITAYAAEVEPTLHCD